MEKKNNWFYTNEEIKRMKELIRTGDSIRTLAFREHQNFNTTSRALSQKMYEVAKHTRKVKKRNTLGNRGGVTLIDDNRVVASKSIAIPSGTVFEGECKRVTLHSDHFRIYF